MKELKADGSLSMRAEICGGKWRAAVIDSDGYPQLQTPGKVERHAETDELFVVLSGLLVVGVAASGEGAVRWTPVKAGEAVCVPKGTWHSSYAQSKAVYILVEDADTGPRNTEAILRFIPKMNG